MIIAIASGKGGTGKTTIATNMALSIGNVQLLDCDVEEPDSHLFLDMELEKQEDVYILVPIIDDEKCTFCGACSKFCQYNAIGILPSETLFFPELCHGCGGCTLVCPEDAIKEEKRVIGVIEGGKKDGLEFFHGLLNIGEPMATPVIRALKGRIRDHVHVILDSPPGNACPVIETVQGSDFCILVTEPTPFGLHDLKLAVDVIRKMAIPFGVVVNRDGVGDDRVERFCMEEKIPILLTIPQDESIAKLYSKGRLFVEDMPEWKERFCELVKMIDQEVRV